MINLYFVKCVQNTWNVRFEINAFCIRFKTLCGEKIEKKCAKTGVFVINYNFSKCVQNTGKSRFEMNGFCMRFETLCGDKS